MKVLIVGAGPAGAALAFLLARNQVEVTLSASGPEAALGYISWDGRWQIA